MHHRCPAGRRAQPAARPCPEPDRRPRHRRNRRRDRRAQVFRPKHALSARLHEAIIANPNHPFNPANPKYEPPTSGQWSAPRSISTAASTTRALSPRACDPKRWIPRSLASRWADRRCRTAASRRCAGLCLGAGELSGLTYLHLSTPPYDPGLVGAEGCAAARPSSARWCAASFGGAHARRAPLRSRLRAAWPSRPLPRRHGQGHLGLLHGMAGCLAARPRVMLGCKQSPAAKPPSLKPVLAAVRSLAKTQKNTLSTQTTRAVAIRARPTPAHAH